MVNFTDEMSDDELLASFMAEYDIENAELAAALLDIPYEG
jgi:hypothetical protein